MRTRSGTVLRRPDGMEPPAYRRVFLLLCIVMFAAAGSGGAAASDDPAVQRYPAFRPGAPGLGDPYFPLDGNGGYDARHYLLDLSYDPSADLLEGTATITAEATQDLAAFNLDLDGLTVRSVAVDGDAAAWTRSAGELTVTPRRGIREGQHFSTEVAYGGTPEAINAAFGTSGFLHTDDGAVVAGQPHVAATWFPVNDHPRDKASYTFRISVPEGLEAVANGRLADTRTDDEWTAWTWEAEEPMASYLATVAVGEFDVDTYRSGQVRFSDALDPDLFGPLAAPQTGTALAWSQAADSSYKRLSTTISVPEAGARLSFSTYRLTEPGADFFFVEARKTGTEDWTTLRDRNGHTMQLTGFSCPGWLSVHPFLAHYQTDTGNGRCKPAGTTGIWWAASGAGTGWEQWEVDLATYAGQDVEVSLTYASDEEVQADGVFLDDIVVDGGSGSTSFEDDGDRLDGWTVAGAPAGSTTNTNDWSTEAKLPPPLGTRIRGSLDRQPEIIGFLAGLFGEYPFRDAGAIVDDVEEMMFALENQTRPVYGMVFFFDPVLGESIIVHELAHQWFGDSLAVDTWQHTWLNEGFATYAEWLWSEREGLGTVQELFDFYAGTPARDPFWRLTIGDPGPEALFDEPVYVRGAMTLHRLRSDVGDRTFFGILAGWAAAHQGGNVTTAEFIELAEKESGRDLGPLFDEWLFTAAKPKGLPEPAEAQSAGPGERNYRQSNLPPVRSLELRIGSQDGNK
jgi:hypothetical protein